jgi:cysteine-rich repeat protein
VDSCQQVSARLEQLCNDLGNATGAYCYGHATFFWAHDVPRCSGRLEFPPIDYMADELPRTYAFDLTGVPRLGAGDGCGDGEIDPGETCDDGNHDLWDGCDSNCQEEEFTGCETVIENEFAVANVAWIDRTDWASPRSHLMIHKHAGALRPMDRALCGEAKATAATVCARLQQDMPFVGWCDPRVEYLESSASCAVRLTVGFQALDPSHGVFTTSLQGILSFTIR